MCKLELPTYVARDGNMINGHSIIYITDCDGDLVPVVGLATLEDIKKSGDDYFEGFDPANGKDYTPTFQASNAVVPSSIESKNVVLKVLPDTTECKQDTIGKPGDRIYYPKRSKGENVRITKRKRK